MICVALLPCSCWFHLQGWTIWPCFYYFSLLQGPEPGLVGIQVYASSRSTWRISFTPGF